MNNKKKSYFKGQLYRIKIRKRQILRNAIILLGLFFIIIGGIRYITHNHTSSEISNSNKDISKTTLKIETTKEEIIQEEKKFHHRRKKY